MVIGVALWVVPDPLGKALKLGRFWRGNSKHQQQQIKSAPKQCSINFAVTKLVTDVKERPIHDFKGLTLGRSQRPEGD